MRPYKHALAGLLAITFGAANSNAAVLTFSGDFTTAINTSIPGNQGVSNFTATWSFTFDDAMVNTSISGFQEFDITPIIFSGNATTGFTYTMPGAIARVTYHDGGGDYELRDVSINGTPAGAQFVDGSADDFAFGYQPLSDFGSVVQGYSGTGDAAQLLISRAGAPGTQTSSADSGSFTVTEVAPEPASTALLGVAGFALILRRKK